MKKYIQNIRNKLNGAAREIPYIGNVLTKNVDKKDLVLIPLTAGLLYAAAGTANAADYMILDRTQNIRSSPVVKSDNKIGKLEKGSKVKVLEEIKGKNYTWAKIKDVTGDGVDDYVAILSAKPKDVDVVSKIKYEFPENIGNVPKDDKIALEIRLEKEGLFKFITESGYKGDKSGIAGYTISVINKYNKDAEKKDAPEFTSGFGKVDYSITDKGDLVTKLMIPQAGKKDIEYTSTIGYELDLLEERVAKKIKKKKSEKAKPKDKVAGKPSKLSMNIGPIYSMGGKTNLAGAQLGINYTIFGLGVSIAQGDYSEQSVLKEETITGTRFNAYGRKDLSSDIDVKEVGINAKLGPLILEYIIETNDKTDETKVYEALKDKNGNVLASNTDSYVSKDKDKDGKFRAGLKLNIGKGFHIKASRDLTGKNKRTAIGLGYNIPLRTTNK